MNSLTRVIVIITFFLPGCFLIKVSPPDAILNYTKRLMKQRGCEIETGLISEIGQWQGKEIFMVHGRYEESNSNNKIPYGEFLFFVSKEKGFKKFIQEDFILHSGDDGLRPLFVDINEDGSKDLVLHAGDEEHFSTEIYMLSYVEERMRFKKIYENGHAYIYPFDFNRDGVPEFIVPFGDWWSSEILISQCLSPSKDEKIKENIRRELEYLSGVDKPSDPLEGAHYSYYFSKVKFLNFTSGHSQDVSHHFKSILDNRGKMFERILRTKMTHDWCQSEIRKILDSHD